MNTEEELSEGFVGFSDEGGLRKARSSKRKLSGSSGHALSENNVVLYTFRGQVLERRNSSRSSGA